MVSRRILCVHFLVLSFFFFDHSFSSFLSSTLTPINISSFGGRFSYQERIIQIKWMPPYRFRVRPCRYSMLSMVAHKCSHMHIRTTQCSQDKTSRFKESTMAAEPNYFSNRSNRPNTRERCTLHAQIETLCLSLPLYLCAKNSYVCSLFDFYFIPFYHLFILFASNLTTAWCDI